MSITREHCNDASKALNETNDCVVRALSVATDISYPAMHEYLGTYGRKPRDGMSAFVYHAALKSLGYKLTKLEGPEYKYYRTWVEGHYRYNRKTGRHSWVNDTYRTKRKKSGPGKDYSAATVKTLAKELTEGTYLVGTSGHVACLKDGEIHDWTAGRRHRIEDVYKVEENNDC